METVRQGFSRRLVIIKERSKDPYLHFDVTPSPLSGYRYLALQSRVFGHPAYSKTGKDHLRRSKFKSKRYQQGEAFFFLSTANSRRDFYHFLELAWKGRTVCKSFLQQIRKGSTLMLASTKPCFLFHLCKQLQCREIENSKWGLES